MMWVIRAGEHSIFYDQVLKKGRIFIAWKKVDKDLSTFSRLIEFKELIQSEYNTDNRTTISNLGCQLQYFVNEMKNGDFVMIPKYKSRYYILGQISGEYEYLSDGNIHHFRKINILKDDISRDIFPVSIIRSMGAYRTVFRVKQEREILDLLNISTQ